MRASLISSLSLAALVLAACGPSGETQTAEAPPPEAAPAAAAPAAAPAPEPAPAPERLYGQVDADRLIVAEEAEPGQWLSVGRDYGEERFSPLDQITDENIGELGLAWFADYDTNRGQEATPVMVDGVLYVSTAWSKVYAFDARTGEQLWRYDPEVPGEWGQRGCCDVVNRGVAVWNGKVYVGAYDGRLIAIDAETGEEVWDVNTIDREWPYSITGAPRIVKGKVVIGNGGAELGVRGYVTAYDAETGEEAWRFYTVPGNPALGFENDAMEMAAETWSGEWWTLGGGGTVWDGMAYDPDLDLLYIGVGNGSPWSHAYRSEGEGDNLFLSSIVALDPDDGSYVWHYQESPGESWDYTATQPIIVTDLELPDGTGGVATRRVVMHAPKNGFFYVLDAGSGELLSADPFVDGITWASGIDMATGRPIENPGARFYRTGVPFLMSPSAQGAHAWHPMSYSRDTGYVYLPVVETASVMSHPETFTPRPLAGNTGTAGASPERMAELGIVPRGPSRAYLLAWDPVLRAEVWRSDYKGGIGSGALSTAGNVVFHGSPTGTFYASRATDGEQLWSFDAQTGVVAAASSYEIDGEQYVAVNAGYGTVGYGRVNNSRLLVFKLGGTAELPPKVEYPPLVLNPPPMTASAEVVAQGDELFYAHCAMCHETNYANRALFPDLRYSAALNQAAVFEAIVIGGALTANGMASFDAALDPPDAEAIRAYLISRAHQQLAAQAPPPPPPPVPEGDEEE